MEQKIAVCITTTPNRKNICNNTLRMWMDVLPADAIIYVHNDENYEGVSISKNRCLANSEWADYVFCFDDDIWPVTPQWANYYINSGLQHACYTFDRKVVKDIAYYKNFNVNHYSFCREFEKPNGCMLFFTRKCIDTAGGWDTNFKGYGFEHLNLSDRIFNMGLTPARYIDVIHPDALFDMANCNSSFSASDRRYISANLKLQQEKFYDKHFIPYK